MFTKLNKKQSGFTIVELLIVIVVIGILAALVLNTFSGVQARARDTERRTDTNAIATQLEVYYADNGHYPDGSTAGYELSTANLPGIDAEALNAPSGTAVNVGAFTTGTDNDYYYTAASCSSGECTGFDLNVDLESESSTYTKSGLNN